MRWFVITVAWYLTFALLFPIALFVLFFLIGAWTYGVIVLVGLVASFMVRRDLRRRGVN